MFYRICTTPLARLLTATNAARRPRVTAIVTLLAVAGMSAAGCVTTKSTDPQFGKKQSESAAPDATAAAGAAAFSPAAIGRSVSKSFKAGTEKVTGAFKTKKEEEPTRETTVAWWPFKKKDEGPGADFYVSLARVQEQTGDFDQAAAQYNKALDIDEESAPALVGYAHMLDRQGQKVKATDYYLRAAKAHPDDPSIANDLGLCYARQGKLDLAVEYLGKAVELQPERELYRNNIATVLVEKGRIDEAVSHVATVYGEPIAHYNVGVLLTQQGQNQAAMQQFALAARQDPSMQQARQWLARLQADVPAGEQRYAAAQRPEAAANPGENQPTAHTQPVAEPYGQPAVDLRSTARVASRYAPAARESAPQSNADLPVAIPSTESTPADSGSKLPPLPQPGTSSTYTPPSRY